MRHPQAYAFFLAMLCAACAKSGSDDQGTTDDGDLARWCCPPNVGECHCPTTQDTCSGGENMTNPRVAGAAVNQGDGAAVRITWDAGTGPGASLASAYFDGAKPTDTLADAGANGVVRVVRSAERELLLTLHQSIGELSGETVRGRLEFPDRQTASSCRHPGMPDRYFLDVSFTFDGAGGVVSSSFEQSASLGDI